MTLTISLPPDAESKLKERATALGQDITHYVEQLVARDIASPAPGEPANLLDDQYQRGYAAVPEDVSDVVALLPYLGVETGEWE